MIMKDDGHLLIRKDRSEECRRIDVEVRLYDKPDDDLRMSDGEMPPIEIRFDTYSPIHSDETTHLPVEELSREKSSSYVQKTGAQSLLHLTSSLDSDPLDTENQFLSSSVFSLQDFLSGGTNSESAVLTSVQSSSSFFHTITEFTKMEQTAKNEQEEGSVMSTPFFDSSDFSPMYWRTTLTENEVMAGLAVVYITLSLTHPLLFLAGALTAVSTATAVGAGYDLFFDGPIGRCLCNKDSTETSLKAPALATEATADKSEPLTLTADTETLHAMQKQTATCNTVVCRDANVSALLGMDQTSPTTLATTSTLDTSPIPDNWLETHYPPLEKIICEKHEFFGLNVKQFFQVFLADNAPYNYKEFQIKRGDKDIEYGKWHVCLDDDSQITPLSMHCDARTPFPHELDYYEYLTRTNTFRAKTNNTFLGPPYATTTKEQRIFILNKKFGVFELKTTLADIPFCDRFYVMERWIITANKDDKGNYKCQISTSCQVFFVKSCPFESQIRTKTCSSIQDVASAWFHMADQALILSAQHKQERIRQEQQGDFSDTDDESSMDIGQEEIAGEAAKNRNADDETIPCSDEGESHHCPHSMEMDLQSYSETHDKPTQPKRRIFKRIRTLSTLSSASEQKSLSNRLVRLVTPSSRRRRTCSKSVP